MQYLTVNSSLCVSPDTNLRKKKLNKSSRSSCCCLNVIDTVLSSYIWSMSVFSIVFQSFQLFPPVLLEGDCVLFTRLIPYSPSQHPSLLFGHHLLLWFSIPLTALLQRGPSTIPCWPPLPAGTTTAWAPPLRWAQCECGPFNIAQCYSGAAGRQAR